MSADMKNPPEDQPGMEKPVKPEVVKSGTRLLGRILVILLAALAVAGATMVLVNRGALDRWLGGASGQSERGDFDVATLGERPARPEGEFNGRGGGRGGHDEGGGLGLQTVTGLLRNLATIGAVVLLVGLAGWVGARLGARRATGRTAKAPPEKSPSNYV